MEVFKTHREYFKMAGIFSYQSDPSQNLFLIRFSKNLASLSHSTPVYRNDFFEITLSYPQMMRFSVSGFNQETQQNPVLSCIAPLEIQQCTAHDYSGDIKMLLISPELLEISNYQSPFFKRYPLFDPKKENSLELTQAEFSELELIYDQLEREISFTSSAKYTFEKFYLKLSKILVVSQGKPASSNRKEEIFQRFLAHIQSSNLSSKSIKHFAEEMAISYTHLSDTVKEVSNLPPSQHLKRFLNKLAQTHLLYTQLSGSEIAFELGFSSPAHFSSFFKEMNGITPIQFRKKPKNM